MVCVPTEGETHEVARKYDDIYCFCGSSLWTLVLPVAPASYFSLMMMPADLVNAVAINQLQNTGIGLFVLAYLFNALRKGTTESNRSEMMQHHAVGWGTWGVLMLAMMTASGQLNAGNLFMWQAIIFLIIAAAFYLLKDGNSVTSQA